MCGIVCRCSCLVSVNREAAQELKHDLQGEDAVSSVRRCYVDIVPQIYTLFHEVRKMSSKIESEKDPPAILVLALESASALS